MSELLNEWIKRHLAATCVERVGGVILGGIVPASGKKKRECGVEPMNIL